MVMVKIEGSKARSLGFDLKPPHSLPHFYDHLFGLKVKT
jgi:hypothetical protein